MDKIELKDYKKILPKEIIKQAQKMIVRELDEVKPSQYESYVDDGSETYDVVLLINKTGAISKGTCDCEDGSKTFCVHKTAVLISIVEKRNVGSKAVKVKANPLKLLLNDTDVHKLKDWVWELLQKNKDLQMAFTHQFSTKPQIFLPTEIKKITNDATKAVSRSRKNLEISELKKLVDLWEGIHSPIINQYLTDVTNERYFENVHTILDTAKVFYSNINTNSVKINKYIEEIFTKITNAILIIIDDNAWLRAINYFVHKSDNNLQILNNDYFKFLFSLISLEKESRKQQLIILLANTHKQSLFVGTSFLMARQEAVLEIIITASLFKDYAEMFKPQRYENTYNLKLIKCLLENEKLLLAEKYCNEQIASNYYEEYNTPYLLLLKDIYTLNKDGKKLNEIKTKLLTKTYDFTDYKDILKSYKDDVKKKEFRSNILAKAKAASKNGSGLATNFCFEILNEEKSYIKMIGLINNSISYSYINKYFEQMFLANKDGLMLALFNKHNDSWRVTEKDKRLEQEYFVTMYDLIIKHYGKNTIAIELREYCSKRFHTNTAFVQFLKNKIEDQYREN